MNGNEEKKMPEYIFRGDPRACALMGRQRPPEDGEGIRRSCFAFCMYTVGKYPAFHTLARALLALLPMYVDFLTA